MFWIPACACPFTGWLVSAVTCVKESNPGLFSPVANANVIGTPADVYSTIEPIVELVLLLVTKRMRLCYHY